MKVAGGIFVVAIVLGAYSFATRPADPLDRLELPVTGEDIPEIELVDGTSLWHQYLRTSAPPALTSEAVGKALRSKGLWTYELHPKVAIVGPQEFKGRGDVLYSRYRSPAGVAFGEISIEQDWHDPKGALITVTRRATPFERAEDSVDRGFVWLTDHARL